MTKRIVSGIFILTALGALGVILAGALTSGEQLIVRFLTAVIVAALGLYVISDLRLQADDDAMTSRSTAQARLATVDAPPNSTAAFMATVTKKTEDLEQSPDQLLPAALSEPAAVQEPASVQYVASGRPEAVPAATKLTDAGVFGQLEDLADLDNESDLQKSEQTMVGVGATGPTTGDFGSSSSELVASAALGGSENGAKPEELGLGARRVVSSRPNEVEAIRASDLSSSSDATVTDLFAGMHPPTNAKLTNDGEAVNASDAEDGDDDSPAEDDADLTQLLRIGDGMPVPLGIVSEFKSGDANEPIDSRSNPFENGATTAKISFSSDSVGDNVSFSGTGTGLNGAEKLVNGHGTQAVNGGDDHVDNRTDDNADGGDTDEVEYEVHDLDDLDEDAAGDNDSEQSMDPLTEQADDGATEFEYSDELQAADHAWPPPAAKLNGAKKAHPFDAVAGANGNGTSGLNGHNTMLPVPASSVGMQAADYADAPLAPIIDLRDINGQNSDNVDIAINAGELEVISTLIEQGMLSTDGPISDRDVRTMVYVAFTSNELRKLLLAGGTPDGPNFGLDLGPVELFDERVHAPAPKRLYSSSDRPEAQSQIG